MTAETGPRLAEPIDLLTLWRLGGLSVIEVAFCALKSYRQHQLSARSAQFAYYAMLMFAPLLIVVIATVALFPVDGMIDNFLRAIDVGLPESAVQLIDRQVQDIQANSSLGLVGAGLVLLGVVGVRLFLTIGAGLDAAYSVRRRRFFKAGGLALGLTFGIFVLLLVAMLLLLIGPAAARFVNRFVVQPWILVLLSDGVRWGVVCGFMLLATATVYWVIPSVKLPWHWISPGSLFATVGWVVVTQGFRIYVENFSRYNETYGALAGVIVMMVWLYMTGAVLLMGGEINSVIHQAIAEKRDEERLPETAGTG